MVQVDPLHARYPFFESAREAVRAIDASLEDLVAADAPAVARGRQRVERALREGTTAPPDPGEWSARDELLSYPFARILVSLLEDPAVVEKYATSEAETAAERFAADLDRESDLRSAGGPSLSVDRLLAEFDLSAAVRRESATAVTGRRAGDRRDTWFRVDVGPYLDHAPSTGEERWRLVTRELVEGEVRVDREELLDLLAVAVRRRVAEGLPFEGIDDATREALAPQLSALRSLLSDRAAAGRVDVDRVVPDLFPACLRRLCERAADGEELPPVARFALVSFLVGLGLDDAEIRGLCGDALGEAGLRYQVERLRSDRGGDGVEGVQYPPPSFETLAALGVCEDPAAHREVADHPLPYYARRLAAADEEGSDRRGRDDGREGVDPRNGG